MRRTDGIRRTALPIARARRAWLLGGAVILSGACAFAGLGMSSTMAHAEVARAFSSEQETDGVIVTLDGSASSAATGTHAVDGATGRLLDGTGSAIGSDGVDDAGEPGVSLAGLSDGKVHPEADAASAVTSATRMVDGSVVATIRPSDGASDEDLAQSLVGTPGIKSVDPNYAVSVTSLGTKDAAAETPANPAAMPNDPLASVYDSTNTTTGNQWYLKASNVTGAWDEGYATSKRVTVAVIDNGTVLTHPDLKDNLDLENAYDAGNGQSLQDTFKEYGFYSSDATGMPEHGTHVTGIVGATAGNGLGIAGVSYNAKVLPIKVTEDKKDASGKVTTTMHVSDVIKGMTYLFGAIDSGKVQNCRVANVSISWYDDEVKAAHQVFATARDKYGLTVVAAGGNGDKNLNARTDASYPSDYDECISVTSLEPDGTNSKWSDYNQAKDISAPGSLIWSTIPDTAHVDSGKNTMGTDTGTSMAAPIVSGIAAMMYASVPKATTKDVYDAMRSTAKKVSSAKNDHTGKTGSAGAIDAEAAIKAIEKKYAVDANTNTNTNSGNANTNTNGNHSGGTNGNSNGNANTNTNTNQNQNGGKDNGNTPARKHSVDELKGIRMMVNGSEMPDFSYDRHEYSLTVNDVSTVKLEVIGLPAGWKENIASGATMNPSTGNFKGSSQTLTLTAEDGTEATYRFLFSPAASMTNGNAKSDDASNGQRDAQGTDKSANLAIASDTGSDRDGTLVQTGDGMATAIMSGIIVGAVSAATAIIMRRASRR